jgi:anti-sigma B factor antagonist
MPETRVPDPSQPTPAADGDDQIAIVTKTPATGRVVIEVGGEVDMLTSPQLRRVVLDRMGEDPELIVLALDGVSFLGTSGLAVLIEVREAAHTTGVELRLACTQRRVLRPLAIAGLVPLFDIHDTLELALART